MRQLRRHPLVRSLPRRLGAAVTLLAYAVTALGIPLPVPAAKDTSVPYPCQDHPCGCLSAEQCWTNCCCTTAAQRWAWARAHGVIPPDYAQRPTEEGETPSCGESCCHDGDAREGCRSCEEPDKPTSAPAPFRLGPVRNLVSGTWEGYIPQPVFLTEIHAWMRS